MRKTVTAIILGCCMLVLGAGQSYSGDLLDSALQAVSIAAQEADTNIKRSRRACFPLNDAVYGNYNGYFTMEGALCGNSADMVYHYNTYSNYPGMFTSGGHSAFITVDNLYAPSSLGFVMSGGPVFYSIDGLTYTVYFNDFSMVCGVSYFNDLAIYSVSGGLTIDGYYIPASLALAELLF